MAKSASQNKLQSKQGEVVLEHNVISDDNLLPPADELVKLNSISPNIVPWIMQRTELEQNARIKFNEDKMSIAKGDATHHHRFNYVALFMAFLIAAGFLVFSYLLVVSGKEVSGTIFAGGTVALIISYFLKTNK